MKYICSECNYETGDKSNYNKHVKSVTHKQMVTSNHIVITNGSNNKVTNKNFVCGNCDRHFTNKQNLSRHKIHYCKKSKNDIDDKDKKINELTEKINMLSNEVQMYKNQAKNNKTINNTYHISVKNYLQQNYPNAPALAGLTDYAKLEYDNEYDDFIDALVYNYDNSQLNKYIGDFIISSYKKDDPSIQSIWSSDVARLTYIIKELLANNESIWNHDYKGVIIKMRIINPILKYIKEYINGYWVKNLHSFETCDINQLNKLNKIYTTIYQIKKDIDGDILGNDIIKYITPYFYINRNKEVNDNRIEYFIDNDIN